MLIENSAKAVVVTNEQVLLIRNIDTYGDWYCLPGGRQQPGESLVQALVRECQEEINVLPTVGKLLYVREYIHENHEFRGKGRNQHKVEFMFLCQIDDIAQVKCGSAADDSQQEIVWMPLDRLHDTNIFPRGLRALRELLLSKTSVYWGDVL